MVDFSKISRPGIADISMSMGLQENYSKVVEKFSDCIFEHQYVDFIGRFNGIQKTLFIESSDKVCEVIVERYNIASKVFDSSGKLLFEHNNNYNNFNNFKTIFEKMIDLWKNM